MVPGYWSNDAMVLMDRCGLLLILVDIADILLKVEVLDWSRLVATSSMGAISQGLNLREMAVILGNLVLVRTWWGRET